MIPGFGKCVEAAGPWLFNQRFKVCALGRGCIVDSTFSLLLMYRHLIGHPGDRSCATRAGGIHSAGTPWKLPAPSQPTAYLGLSTP